MSQVKLSGNASGSGSVTIASPNTNSAYTITLPAATGTFLTTASAGTVLQVVNATTTTVVTRTTTGLVDTTLTATITPSASTSKVLVLIHQNGIRKQGANTYMEFPLLRGASILAYFAYAQGYTGTTIDLQSGTISVCYLDSPATTSATTYKTQFNNAPGGGTCSVQVNNDVSTITLMEIAA
jgi:hypothetical protein